MQLTVGRNNIHTFAKNDDDDKTEKAILVQVSALYIGNMSVVVIHAKELIEISKQDICQLNIS